MDVLAWLDAVAGLSLLAVGLVGWRHYRTSAAFAAAAAVAWFVVPVAPALVLLHRPLLFHSVLALPGRPVAGLLPRLLLLTAWIGLLLPAAAQPWVALATAALAVAVALKAAVVARPALLALAVGLALPVVERAVWPQYVDAGLAVATYLCAVTACSAAMLLEMLGSGLRHADSVIELSDRTPDQALAALRPLATAEASTRPGGPLASALALLEDNMRLQQDLAERIDEVRASRARLIEATSDERQRLERMLSDGVMRYLDGLEENLDSMADHEHADPMLAACRRRSHGSGRTSSRWPAGCIHVCCPTAGWRWRSSSCASAVRCRCRCTHRQDASPNGPRPPCGTPSLRRWPTCGSTPTRRMSWCTSRRHRRR